MDHLIEDYVISLFLNKMHYNVYKILKDASLVVFGMLWKTICLLFKGMDCNRFLLNI